MSPQHVHGIPLNNDAKSIEHVQSGPFLRVRVSHNLILQLVIQGPVVDLEVVELLRTYSSSTVIAEVDQVGGGKV